jgi:antitoxin YefM
VATSLLQGSGVQKTGIERRRAASLQTVLPECPMGSSLVTIGRCMVDGIQYISDENNQITGVIVPIDLWREIQAEKETAYLLKTETMKKRLLEAKDRKQGIPLDEAREKLGI